MQCPNCGNTIKPESKFCPRCAFNLRQAAAPPAPSAPERQPDNLERKWEKAAQQFGQQSPRPAEPPPPRRPEPPPARQPEPVKAASAQSCPRCGAAVNPGQKFCMSCAAPLTESASAPAPYVPQMQVPPQPLPNYPAQQPQAQDWGAQQPYSMTEPAGSGKMIIAVVVGVLLLAAAGVGAYFLFFNKGAAAGNTNTQTNQSAVAGNTNSPITTNTNTATATTTTTTTTSGANLSGVVNTLLQAMKDGDASALRSNIARNASANADSIINDIRAKGTMTSYKLTSEPAAFEDRGVAFFTFDWGSGNQSTGLMNLVKEDGAWKLDSFVMF